MTDSSPDSRTFSDSRPADEITYRAVSPAAIAVFVLGLASLAAFLSPLLWTIPVGALGLGLFTLGRLKRDADRYTGARLVNAGMLIALLCLGWAPARYVQRLTILEHRAATVAREWVQLVCEGRLEEAHQWHLTSSSRAAPGTSIAAFYAERPEMVKLQQDFLSSHAIQHWLRRGPGTEARYRGYIGREVISGSVENYVIEFSIHGGKGQGELPIFVIVTRETRESGGGEMFIAGVHGMSPFIKER